MLVIAFGKYIMCRGPRSRDTDAVELESITNQPTCQKYQMHNLKHKICHFKNQIIITNNIITIQNTNIHPLLNIIKNIEFTVHNTKQTIQNTEYKHLKGRELVRSQPFQHHKQIPNRPLFALKKITSSPYDHLCPQCHH